MEDIKATPSQRLKWVLKELKTTPYKFSKGLDYKSPDTIYNILKGKNGICNNLLFRIRFSQYPINPDWLRYGIGKPLYHNMEIGDANEIGTKEKILYPGLLNFEFIKKIAENLEPVIGIDGCKVEVRITGILGLEFKFTTFFEDDTTKISRYYSIILSPDWMVSSYFDFWSRPNLQTLRCQNILKLYPDINQLFMTAIYPIHMEIKHFVLSQPERLIPPDFQYLKSSESFTELYTTDPIIE